MTPEEMMFWILLTVAGAILLGMVFGWILRER